MSPRLVSGILAVLALITAGAHFSGAAFTGSSANPSNTFAAAAVFPGVTLNDPGANLRGSAVALTVSTSGTIVSVTYQRTPAGGSTWTDICTSSSSPYTCNFDTTAAGDGLYDLRATADTGSGTLTSNFVANRRVDNTAPVATMTDPGASLGGTINLQASATDTGGSGIFALTIQRRPSGGGAWTDVCSQGASPASCSTNTSTWGGDGLYDVRAVAMDVAGNPSAYSTVTNRLVDNTVPSVSLTDPGSPLRAIVSLSATATDAGSGLSGGVVFQSSPAGAATWTSICTDASAPYTCSFDTTTVADGAYDLRAYADDAAGNRGTSTVANRSIDNTAPTATDIQTLDGGGTAGKLEQNDAIVFTFSENLDPATIVAGWNGIGSVPVDVVFGDAGAGGGNDTFMITNPNAGGAAVLVNGNVTLGNNYVTRTVTSSASTLTRNTTNRTVTITLSAPSPGNANFRPGGPGNGGMTWPVLSTLKDLVGNSIATASVSESGVADREF